MKKLSILFVCLVAMMVASMSLKAQEVTITLNPGYTWISYLGTESQDFATVLGSFTPAVGDVIMSQRGNATYRGDGQWRGSISQFSPGYGYMYKSNRTEPVTLTLGVPLPLIEVMTTEPTDITTISAVVGGMVTLPEGNHVFLRGICWGMEPNPDIDGSHTVGEAVAGSQADTLGGLTPNTTYYVRAYVVTDYGLAYGNQQSFTTEHEFVDLGLPSGTLWATCNVGADNPEDYGDYFAWGETTPKDTYNWSTYQHYDGSSVTKYTGSDGLTTLLPEDDAATANWGSDWRMPTKEEWQELIDNTTVTWTTLDDFVDVAIFTASNGNSLILPVAGYRDDMSESNGFISDGSFSACWSSSLYTDFPDNAWIIDFGDGLYEDDRYIGHTVRAVHSAPQSNVPTGAIDGKFTINEDGDQVYFSQGNLQYIGSAAEPYWKFAENQWEVLGTTTGQNSANQDVDRDLFGWGTSGWDTGNANYNPWDTFNTSGASYGPAGSNNLTGTYANADWGVYNPISNGGDEPNQWRTPTKNEWGYVFETRATDSGIRYAKAKVNDMNGVILLPDNWCTSYYDLSDTDTMDASFSANTITASEWSVLEQHGAVFLPATGYRFGTLVYNVGSHGYYWSSSFVNGIYAYGVYLLDSNLNPQDCSNRTYGRGVRLVHVAE